MIFSKSKLFLIEYVFCNQKAINAFIYKFFKYFAKLGCLIRNTVILRRSGGVDRRTLTRVDGTSYRDVAASGVEQHDGYQPS